MSIWIVFPYIETSQQSKIMRLIFAKDCNLPIMKTADNYRLVPNPTFFRD